MAVTFRRDSKQSRQDFRQIYSSSLAEYGFHFLIGGTRLVALIWVVLTWTLLASF